MHGQHFVTWESLRALKQIVHTHKNWTVFVHV